AGAPHQGEETVRAPGPVADDRVDKAGDGDAIYQIANETGTADHRARRDGRAGIGKSKLEEPERQERHAAGFIRRRHTVQEEPVVPDESIAVAEHEGETKGVEKDTAQAGIDDAFHQNVDGLARAAEPGLQHGEADLHTENEERG